MAGTGRRGGDKAGWLRRGVIQPTGPEKKKKKSRFIGALLKEVGATSTSQRGKTPTQMTGGEA